MPKNHLISGVVQYLHGLPRSGITPQSKPLAPLSNKYVRHNGDIYLVTKGLVVVVWNSVTFCGRRIIPSSTALQMEETNPTLPFL